MDTNPYQLKIEYKFFQERLSQLIIEAKEFLNEQNRSEGDLTTVQNFYSTWLKGCQDFLKNSFVGDNDLIRGFLSPNVSYLIYGTTIPDLQKIKNTNRNIAQQLQLLYAIDRYSQICDVINSSKPKDRSRFTIEEKEDFILQKLNDLYSDPNYHSPKIILEGNGVNLGRENEDIELIQKWLSLGYVEQASYGNGDTAKITLRGAKYVQGLKKKEGIHSEAEITEMNQKIDEILNGIDKLKAGQEVIFNEIEELKDLYLKLNEKNWTQILTGKLVELGAKKLMEPSTLNSIFNHLTNGTLMLP